MVPWKKWAISAPVLILLSFGAFAEPTGSAADQALDAISRKFYAHDYAGTLEDLGKLAELATPEQTARARYYEAGCYFELKDYKKAAAVLAPLMQSLGGTPASHATFTASTRVGGEKARALMGRIYRQWEQFGDEASVYRDMVADYPKNPEWPLRLGVALHSMGRYAEELPQYQRTLADSPTPEQDARARYQRAAALFESGDADTAAAELQAFVAPAVATAAQRATFIKSAGTGGQKARALLGRIYHERGKHDVALGVYQRLRQDYPKEAEWPLRIAMEYRVTGRAAEAVPYYDVALTLAATDEDRESALVGKVKMLADSDRAQEAYDWLAGLPTPTPWWEVAVAWQRADSLSLYLRRDYATANRLCEEAIAKHSDVPIVRECMLRLARNLLYDMPVAEQDHARAKAILEKLAAIWPDGHRKQYRKVDLAYAYASEGDVASAIAWYRKALDEHRDNFPDGNMHAYISSVLVGLYLEEGDAASAISLFRTMQQKYPDDPFTAITKEYLQRTKAIQ